MTQEEKELLLKDLCGRLPYGVKAFAKTHKGNKIGKVITITTKFIDYSQSDAILGELYNDDECFWLDYGLCKPYLRPMSSMTEEEKKEFRAFGFEVIDHINANREECPKYQVMEVSNFSGITEVTDWLNSHHFDYRNLIEKGLALEAPEGMYK